MSYSFKHIGLTYILLSMDFIFLWAPFIFRICEDIINFSCFHEFPNYTELLMFVGTCCCARPALDCCSLYRLQLCRYSGTESLYQPSYSKYSPWSLVCGKHWVKLLAERMNNGQHQSVGSERHEECVVSTFFSSQTKI